MPIDDTDRSSEPRQTDDTEAARKARNLERRRVRRANPTDRAKAAAYAKSWRAKRREHWLEYCRSQREKKGADGRKEAAAKTKAWRDKQTPQERKETIAAIHAWRRRQPQEKQDAMRRRERALAKARRAKDLELARKKGLEKARIYGPVRRARKAIVNTFTRDDWQTLMASAKRCHWCKKRFSKNNRPTHDHVIPLSRGGGNTLENSVCACLVCNTRKGNRLVNPVTGQGILL